MEFWLDFLRRNSRRSSGFRRWKTFSECATVAKDKAINYVTGKGLGTTVRARNLNVAFPAVEDPSIPLPKDFLKGWQGLSFLFLPRKTCLLV